MIRIAFWDEDYFERKRKCGYCTEFFVNVKCPDHGKPTKSGECN